MMKLVSKANSTRKSEGFVASHPGLPVRLQQVSSGLQQVQRREVPLPKIVRQDAALKLSRGQARVRSRPYFGMGTQIESGDYVGGGIGISTVFAKEAWVRAAQHRYTRRANIA